MRILILNLILITMLLTTGVLAGCTGGGDPVLPPVDFAQLLIDSSTILSDVPDYAYDPKVTVSPETGEIFCCYSKKVGDVPEIHWRHGQPGEFSDEEIMSVVDGNRSFNSCIEAGSDGRVRLAYMNRLDTGIFQKEIFIRTWQNGQWTDEVQLSDPNDWTSWDPDIALFEDGLPAVCWFDHGFGVQHEILVRTEDGAGSWAPWTRMTDDDHWQYYPKIDIDANDMIHLVYVDTREIEDEWYNPDHYREGTNLEIYYRTLDDGVVGPEVRLTDTQFRSAVPQIEVEEQGKAHVIYADETETGHFRLYHRTIVDNQPGTITAISSAAARSDQSDITILDGRVYIVYPEYPDPDDVTYGTTNLYIREILDDNRLGSPLVLASGGANLHPRIAPDEIRGMLWVIWTEYFGDDETLITGESNIHLCGIKVK